MEPRSMDLDRRLQRAERQIRSHRIAIALLLLTGATLAALRPAATGPAPRTVLKAPLEVVDEQGRRIFMVALAGARGHGPRRPTLILCDPNDGARDLVELQGYPGGGGRLSIYGSGGHRNDVVRLESRRTVGGGYLELR